MSEPAWQNLNSSDRFMMVIDRAVRNLGGPGFETVTFVWLDGRAERAHLLRGLEELGRALPAVTARLRRDTPRWEMRPEARPQLFEVDLPSSDRQGVLDYGAGLLSLDTDPSRVDPVRFHLLHLPNGCDVFLAQYSHILTDHARAIRALQRIDTPVPGTAAGKWRDPVGDYLRKFPRDSRMRGAREASDSRKTLRGGAIQIGRSLPGRAGPAASAILSKRLTAEQTRLLEATALRATGLPNLSMAVLASAFRGVERFAAEGPRRGRYWQAGIALDLGLRGLPADVLENRATLVPLFAPLEGAGDRGELARGLSRQLREKLARRMDLSILQLVTCFGRRRARAQWGMDLLMQYTLCFWYAYLGVINFGTTFCGAKVLDVFSAGPTWASVGVTLIASQFAGQLNLQLTYLPESVPHPRAAEYFDWVVADLLAEERG